MAANADYYDQVTGNPTDGTSTDVGYDSRSSNTNAQGAQALTSKIGSENSSTNATSLHQNIASSSTRDYAGDDSIDPLSAGTTAPFTQAKTGTHQESLNQGTNDTAQRTASGNIVKSPFSDAITFSSAQDAPTERRRSSIHPATQFDDVVDPSTTDSPLNPHHRPSISDADPQSDVQGLPGDTTIRRASLAQNAPGRVGEIGENIMGAFGAGGSTVERPKEDQGLGEKIVEFLGM